MKESKTVMNAMELNKEDVEAMSRVFTAYEVTHVLGCLGISIEKIKSAARDLPPDSTEHKIANALASAVAKIILSIGDADAIKKAQEYMKSLGVDIRFDYRDGLMPKPDAHEECTECEKEKEASKKYFETLEIRTGSEQLH